MAAHMHTPAEGESYAHDHRCFDGERVGFYPHRHDAGDVWPKAIHVGRQEFDPPLLDPQGHPLTVEHQP